MAYLNATEKARHRALKLPETFTYKQFKETFGYTHTQQIRHHLNLLEDLGFIRLVDTHQYEKVQCGLG